MKTLSFRSKVDTWLGVILAGAPFLTVWQSGGRGVFVPLLTIAVVYACLVFPMSYKLTETALVVRSGFIVYRRPYVDIVALTPNSSPFSAPALSLDRILVQSRGKGSVNISPKDRERFLNELRKRAPHLVPTQDGGLVS